MNPRSGDPPVLCSIKHCPNHASDAEYGVSSSWHFTVFYCREHAKEIEKGVPVGPVGIDSSRVQVDAIGTVEPRTGGSTPLAPA